MKTIESTELSGYLDGELPEKRMLEIQEAIVNDPQLFAELQELQAQHLSLQTAAKRFAFKPKLAISQPKPWFQIQWIQVAALVILLTLRFAPKFSDIVIAGLILHLLGFAIILSWVINLALSKPVYFDK